MNTSSLAGGPETFPLQRWARGTSLPARAAKPATLTAHVWSSQKLPAHNTTSASWVCTAPVPTLFFFRRGDWVKGGDEAEKQEFGISIGPLLFTSSRRTKAMPRGHFGPWKDPSARTCLRRLKVTSLTLSLPRPGRQRLLAIADQKCETSWNGSVNPLT